MRILIQSCLLLAALMIGLTGCSEPGPAEQAGEKIDETVEQAREAVEDTVEEPGPAEKAGEAVDEAVDEAADSAKKAADNVEEMGEDAVY